MGGQARVKRKTLAEELEEKLRGPRFRVLNELMYKKDGKINPELIKKYHQGFEEQAKKWPFNPVDRVIAEVGNMSKGLKVADLGCGEARMQRKLKKMVVFSYDKTICSKNSPVIECDIRNVPAKSSEMDVAVFSLSLMSEDVSGFVQEANRILKKDGLLKIAEVRSRLYKVDEFVAPFRAHGFSLTKKDLSSNFFVFFDFKKTGPCAKALPGIRMKPCLYKKR
jgi:ribosomal RNA-processing protein 8